MGFRHSVGNQVKLEVNLGRAGSCVIGFQYGNNDRAFAVGRFVRQGCLVGLANLSQGIGELAELFGGRADRLVAALVFQDIGDDVHQGVIGCHDRLLVKDFQPLALVVLGADTDTECKAHLMVAPVLNVGVRSSRLPTPVKIWICCPEIQASHAAHSSALKPTRTSLPFSTTGRLMMDGFSSMIA